MHQSFDFNIHVSRCFVRHCFESAIKVETMPKFNSKKRNSASQSSPYAQAAAKTKAANSIFKMNTDIGQHVLKNPGVAQAIVDKADLKQSDVSQISLLPAINIPIHLIHV